MNLRSCQLLSSRLGRLSIQSIPAIRQHLNPARICIRSKRTSTKPVPKSTAKPSNNLNQPSQTSPKPKPNLTPNTLPAVPISSSQPLKHQVFSSKKAPLLNVSSSPQSYQTISGQSKTLPSRLLIYHSGTLTTTFIGIQKISSIFCFAFLAFFLSPSYAAQPEEPIWRPLLITLLSPLPILLTHRLTSPFTCYIHLILPKSNFIPKIPLGIKTQAPTASTLTASNLPNFLASPTFSSTAQLEITTMNILGRPRISRMFMNELQPLAKTWWRGAANFGRVGNGSGAGPRGAGAAKFEMGEVEKKWWQPGVKREFALRKSCGAGPAGKGVWGGIWVILEKGQKRR